MSIQTYSYEAHFNWKWHKTFDAWATQDEATVKASLTQGFKTAFLAEFAAKMAPTGHWYKMNDVQTNFTAYSSSWVFGLPTPNLNVDATGETVIFFESDVKDAMAHASPQLWQIIYDGIQQVSAWLGDHPEVVVGLLILGTLTVLAVWLINTTSGAIQGLGSNIGTLVLSLAVLGVVSLSIYAFTTRAKPTRRRRG